LFLQTPGSGQAFYRAASVAAGEADGEVDFRKVGEAAKQTGATDILGPSPFTKKDLT
jgi:hypothetical protein